MSFLVISNSSKVLVVSLDPSWVFTTTIKCANKWGERVVYWIVRCFMYGCSGFYLLKQFYAFCYQCHKQSVRCLPALCGIGSDLGIDVIRNLENVTHTYTSSLSLC